MHILIATHQALSIRSEVDKIRRVAENDGHIVTVIRKENLTPDFLVKNSFDGILWVSNTERIPDFLSKHRVVYYLTTEGHTFGYKPSKDWFVVANSNFTKRMLEESGFSVDTVVYHGFDILRFSRVRDTIVHKTRMRGFNRCFMVNKVWTQRNGFELIQKTLIEFYRRYGRRLFIKDFGSIPFGYGLPKDVANGNFIVSYWVMKPLPDDVIFEGYRTSDVYIHQSASEGFGLTLLEALGCGIPSIYVGGEPMTELVYSGYGYRIPVSDVKYVKFEGYPDFDFYTNVYELDDAVEAWYHAYEGDNDSVNGEYINRFNMYDLYGRLINLVGEVCS